MRFPTILHILKMLEKWTFFEATLLVNRYARRTIKIIKSPRINFADQVAVMSVCEVMLS